MMEYSERARSEEAKILEPVLIKVTDLNDRIRIDKNEFKVGCARDNDEIILDINISRRHCVFRCEGEDEWTIKDVSSTSTFVNRVAIRPGIEKKISPGDSIQFGPNKTFEYLFIFAEKDHCAKKPRIDEKILETVLVRQKTFVESQQWQRKEFEDKLETKKKEHIELKQQFEDLLTQQTVAKEDKENLLKQITALEDKIKACNAQEGHINNLYSQVLEKLENERLQFDVRLNEEKQKWVEALDMSKQEKEMLEIKMKDQMEKWREEQQAEWRKMMKNKVKEEKDIQVQLLNEKIMLEAKLKETEHTLKEQEAKVETSQAILSANTTSETIAASTSECVSFNLDQYLVPKYDPIIIDTIALTNDELSQSIQETNIKENVLEKLSDIMNEQLMTLTCTICSELFVMASTLGCMHTFCHHCIKMWNICPVCRKPVMSMIRSLFFDNFIERIENVLPELKNRRKEITQKREVAETVLKREPDETQEDGY